MTNYRFVFYVTEKARTQNWGRVLAQGAKVHGDTVDVRPKEEFTKPLADYDGCGNMGLSRAAKGLMEGHLAAGKFFLFFDKGYTNRSMMRVSVNAWQPLAYFQRFMRPDDRLNKQGIDLQPRRKRDGSKVVVFAGACQNYTNFMSLGNVNDYNLSVLKKLRDHTDRVIIYRPNPSWYRKHYDEFRPIHEEVGMVELSPPDVGFKEELQRTHLLVTHGTGAAVAAMSSGINSMVLGPGIMRPISITEKDWDKIESPDWPKDEVRRQLFADMHYCQWSEEEYSNGAAWEEIRLVLASLKGADEPTPKELIRQYQLMHAHPNYFRGLTTLKYAEQLEKLFAQYKVKSLLDYGSGKGEQYAHPYFLFQDDPVALQSIACYDPAVPRFSKPPKGQWDAVICCDVMEHVAEELVAYTLAKVIGHATKLVFFAIATSPAIKTLPDGRNCHVTVHPAGWWREKIDRITKGMERPPAVVLVTTKKGDDHDTTAG